MDLTQELRMLLGPTGWLEGDVNTAPFSRDWLDRYGTPPLGVARPGTTEEVAALMRLCDETGTAVVPQGGRTGLVGGSVAATTGSILLSLSRLNQIETIDNEGLPLPSGPVWCLERCTTPWPMPVWSFPFTSVLRAARRSGG